MNDDFNYDNEIIEVGRDENATVSFDEELNNALKEESETKVKRKMKNPFKKLLNWFNNLPKKKKILFIIILVIVLLLISGLILFLTLNNKEEEKPKDVVVLEDNFRYDNGTLIFLEDKKEIGKYECIDKDVKKCYVAYLDNESDTFDHESNIDESGNIIKKRSKIYLSNYVFVYDDGKILLYNIKDQKTEEKLESIKAYNTEKDYVVVEDKDNKFGLIEFADDTFTYVINAYYDYLGIVSPKDLLLVSETNKKQRIIGIDNKQLSKEFSITIKNANKEYVSAQSGKKYNLYSYNFEELLSGFDYISFHDTYISLVLDNKLYFRDNKLNKMNEEGILLTNETYNKLNKFDEKNKLISSEVSYEVTINTDNISVLYGEDENEVINKYEGAVSANYAYMNYFNSKLYFYSDEEKEDLIGIYECKNKNKLTSENDSLSTCNIYASSDGVSGIYNNNFVFISDNSSIADKKNITLYSLNEKKNKATYTEINFINTGNVGTNINHYYTEGLYVIAKSASKNSYGVIKLENSAAKNIIAFSYKSITNNNGYYVLENNDGKFSIWNNYFSKISDEFDYVELLKDYYVGVVGTKLNVYRYQTTTNKVLESDITLPSTDYKNAYKITIGTYIVINVGDEEYKYDILTGKKIEDSSIPVDSSEPGV